MGRLLLGLLLLTGCVEGRDGFGRGGADDDDAADDDDDIPNSGLWEQMEIGGNVSCGLRPGGRVQCWGSDETEAISTLPDAEFEDLAVAVHVCGLDDAGELVCWGASGVDGAEPPGPWQDVEAGILGTCAQGPDRSWTCWAWDKWGDPVADAPQEPFDQVAVGLGHACGLRPDGTIACWGGGLNGETDPPAGTWVQIDAERHLTCARASDGAITCWGAGDGTPDHPPGPFVDVAAGLGIACGLEASGAIDCWGLIGDDPWLPVPAAADWIDIDCGTDHCCAQHEDGWMTCFGAEDKDEATVPAPPS